MTAPSEPRDASTLPAELRRRFEAIVCEWDPSAAGDGVSDVSGLRRLIEDSCVAGIDLAIVYDVTPTDLDARVGARPAGPGLLLLAVEHGPEVFNVNRNGPERVQRTATTAPDGAPSLELGLSVYLWIRDDVWSQAGVGCCS
jgi:hypothetical protein